MFLSLTLLFLLCIVQVPKARTESDTKTKVNETIQGWKDITWERKHKKFQRQSISFIHQVAEVFEILSLECDTCDEEVPDVTTRVGETIEGWRDIKWQKKFKKFQPQMVGTVHQVADLFEILSLECTTCDAEVPEANAESNIRRINETLQGWKEVTWHKKLKKFRPQMIDFVHQVAELFEILNLETNPGPGPIDGEGNLAFGKPAIQISTGWDGLASKAVDGNVNSDYSGMSCTHTLGGESNPWWQVDLGEYYRVARVRITNRGDCCSERLNNFMVEVGNPDTTMSLCATHPDAAGLGEQVTLQCPENTAGQFVRVSMHNEDYLTLCEVEVFSV